jgi:hypothetical protein
MRNVACAPYRNSYSTPAAAAQLCACAAHAGLTSELDSLVANSQRTLIVSLTAEVERRAAAVQEASGAMQPPTSVWSGQYRQHGRRACLWSPVQPVLCGCHHHDLACGLVDA